MKVVVQNAFYRGENVTGVFNMVQGFTAFQGEGRRNGRKGAGFIKVAVEGDQLVRLAPNSKPVKLTVEGDGVGYRLDLVIDDEPAAAEFGVDAERELAGEPLTVAEAVMPDVVSDALTVLRAEFEAAKGAERDRLRKRLRRLEAKVAAV